MEGELIKEEIDQSRLPSVVHYLLQGNALYSSEGLLCILIIDDRWAYKFIEACLGRDVSWVNIVGW